MHSYKEPHAKNRNRLQIIFVHIFIVSYVLTFFSFRFLLFVLAQEGETFEQVLEIMRGQRLDLEALAQMQSHAALQSAGLAAFGDRSRVLRVLKAASLHV